MRSPSQWPGTSRSATSLILALGALASLPVRAPQQGQHAGAQLAAWHRVKRRVDGLVREAHRIGHRPKCERNLLWTQAPAQVLDDLEEERAARDQLALDARF
jgi:hypothetical protein